MKFVDCSPPHLPSLDEQRDALQKGLGRSMQWAMNGRLDEEPLLEACLQDRRFDVQCEDSRGIWLWEMIQAVGAVQRFRVPILHALHELSEERSAIQLCELAFRYAGIGDGAFRDRLYEIVEGTPFSTSPWLGEKEIVALDGERAFLFAANVRGQQLASREWEWDDGSLFDRAIDQFSEDRVNRILDASSDAAVVRFLESWRRYKQSVAGGGQASSHRNRMEAVPVEQIIRESQGETKCHWFRGWGIHADETALKAVLQRLWTVEDPRVIANLIKVFSARALPAFDARLIELCRHSDEEVRRRAFAALERNAHPLVREFALAGLQEKGLNRSKVGLFIHNYRDNDERLLLEAIELPDDPCERHWLLMDVVKVLEHNPRADCSQLGLISYALTPCENCRFYAARLLFDQQAAPEWLMEECQHDSAEDCRSLVEESIGSGGAQ
jgi:hypothetical protein